MAYGDPKNKKDWSIKGKESKLIKWFATLKKVLKKESTVLLRDVDLFHLVNSKLQKHERISEAYFNELKSPNQTSPKSLSQKTNLTTEQKEDFLAILNVGRVKQRMKLTEKAFDNDTKNVHAYLWALERKNKDLQLNRNLAIEQTGTTINITVGQEKHKGMIENLLNGNILDIDHEDVTDNEDKLLDNG